MLWTLRSTVLITKSCKQVYTFMILYQPLYFLFYFITVVVFFFLLL